MRLNAILAIAAAAAIAAVHATAAGPPRGVAGKIVFVGGSHVLITNADGTGLRDLSRPVEDVYGIAVSPDGTRMVVDFLGCCLVLMNANGTGRIRIANSANSPSWAPDGKHFAYADESRSGNVHIVSATGRVRRTLHVAANGFAGLAWSRDGSRLAFVTGAGVGVVAAVGGPVTTPRGTSAAESVVGWSPDGAKIAFLTGKQALYVANVDGGAPTLVGRGQDPFSTPAWSPDGKRFLLTSGVPTQIHVVDADGTHDRPLTKSDWGERSSAPTWSPDGKSVVYLRGRFAGPYTDQDVWTMNADGTAKRPLTTAFELNGVGVGPLDQAIAWVPGRAAGGFSIRQPRTIPVHASRAATLPLVDSNISADASGLAVAAGCMVTTWEGTEVRVRGPESGLGRWPCAGGAELASAGGRTAWISFHGQSHDDWAALYLAYRDSRRIVATAYSSTDGEPEGSFLDDLAGDGQLLVYDAWQDSGAGPKDQHLWRLDGTRKELLHSGTDLGRVVAVDSSRIATLRSDGMLTLSSAGGTKLASYRLGQGVETVRLDGPRVVLLRYGRLEVFDAASGRRTRLRPLEMLPHTKATLEDAQDGLVVYVAGLAVHVLRLADGRDVVLGLKDEASAAHAQLVPGGLYYAYNEAWKRRPGRLGFVSSSELGRLGS